MATDTLTLGSLLRLLNERVDRDVEAAYRARGLPFKPRYTSIFRLLSSRGEMRVGEIVSDIGLSQPSITNTLAAMRADGLVEMRRGRDARERIVSLTSQSKAISDELESQWRQTAVAAESLNKDLGLSLEAVLREALRHLDRRSFGIRMTEAGK